MDGCLVWFPSIRMVTEEQKESLENKSHFISSLLQKLTEFTTVKLSPTQTLCLWKETNPTYTQHLHGIMV